jgi:hypothetical protein
MPPRRGLSRVELLQGTLDMIILQTLRWEQLSSAIARIRTDPRDSEA